MTESPASNPFMDALPPAVRAAILAHDEQALEKALQQMPGPEAEGLARWLVIAGVLVEGQPDNAQPVQPPAPQTAPAAPASPWPPAVARALATGNRDRVYEALADLPPELADALYVKLQEQGLL